jgi:hypothetical protein
MSEGYNLIDDFNKLEDCAMFSCDGYYASTLAEELQKFKKRLRKYVNEIEE